MSQITTHVLDTSEGKPADGIKIELQKRSGTNRETIADGITDSDGRIADLLEKGEALAPGEYRMHFHTAEYFKRLGLRSFYPEVSIVFETFDESHYHVPLLLNPFGYSTYRGS